MNRYFRSLAGLSLAFFALAAGAKEISGRVVAVADGDTATVLVACRLVTYANHKSGPWIRVAPTE